MPPRLTIGMATYNDFDGCYFTIQALRLYHAEKRLSTEPSFQESRADRKIDWSQIELVIVDNAPGSSHSQMLQGLAGNANIKYIPLTGPVGTSPSRNAVFREATGDFVLCMDSHVLLVPGAIEKLLTFIPDAGPHLYQAPMLMDHLKGVCSHFNPEWRSEMYGTWGAAYQCPCGKTNFSIMARGEHAAPFEMPLCQTRIGACGDCGKQIPSPAWAGHEQALQTLGFKVLGSSPESEPYEIPGQGLGLFGCRREAWLGFTPHATGFGGEELNIHELYRQKGHKCISLPFLTWLHKFGRPNGVPYPLQRYHKVRNYVLWHKQLGKPLDDIQNHFVDSRLLSVEHWNHLIVNPVMHIDPPPACGSCGQTPTIVPDTIEAIYQNTLNLERDSNRHMPKLRELADNCKTVTDISIRQESFIALAASKAEVVYSHSNEHNTLTDHVVKLRGKFVQRLSAIPQNIIQIQPTDLLFLNTTHTANQVSKELAVFAPSVRHYIVLHNTMIYGETGEGHTEQAPVPGILLSVRHFMRQNPEWSVIYHSTEQFGLTVLSKDPADKKRLPGKLTMAGNFAKAIAEHVLDGAQKSLLPIMEARLDICAGCEQRTEGNCSVCGCDLATKASWKSSVCPLGLWPEAES